QPLNLRKMIVRRVLPKTTKAGTFPCNSNRCETYKSILCKDQGTIPNTQKVYTIQEYYSCASSNVRNRTNLCKRMNHHKHKINTKSCDTPVGQDFCNQNHSLQDMKVLILKGKFKTEKENL
ncbi:hypothetical protein XELAEV_18042029mg, partial [Xenopus laevis]